MHNDLEDPLAEHQFIAAALRKCPDAMHGGHTHVRVTRVQITEGEGVHIIAESQDLVHGAIVSFGVPDAAQSVFVFVDEAREEPVFMAHQYARAHQHGRAG